ncbi:MAG: transposase [Nitrososphaerota archaeon]|nr:transposase [Nitrososphaerota archaeon]
MKFKSLTDEQWEYIEPILPPLGKEGKPRADDSTTTNAILYVLKTSIPWNDLPGQYGDDSTANRRLRRSEEEGVWKRIMDSLLSDEHSEGKLKVDRLSIDSDTIPAKKGRAGRLRPEQEGRRDQDTRRCQRAITPCLCHNGEGERARREEAHLSPKVGQHQAREGEAKEEPEDGLCGTPNTTCT